MLHRIVGGAGLNIAVAPTAVASYFSHAVVVTTLLAGQHSADLLMPQPRRAQHGYCWAFPMDLDQIGYIVQISHGSLNSNVLFAQFGVFGRSRLTVVEFLLHAEQLHFECVQEEVVGLFPIHFLPLISLATGQVRAPKRIFSCWPGTAPAPLTAYASLLLA